jgi:predicted transcriptional regulator
MSTTSIKLPPEPRERVAAVAEGAGVTAHAFMVAAVEQATALAEKRAAFVASALQARAEYVYSGEYYAADAVHDYFTKRAAGAKPKRPRARSCRT